MYLIVARFNVLHIDSILENVTEAHHYIYSFICLFLIFCQGSPFTNIFPSFMLKASNNNYCLFNTGSCRFCKSADVYYTECCTRDVEQVLRTQLATQKGKSEQMKHLSEALVTLK